MRVLEAEVLRRETVVLAPTAQKPMSRAVTIGLIAITIGPGLAVGLGMLVMVVLVLGGLK